MKKYHARMKGTELSIPRVKSSDTMELKQALAQTTHKGRIDRLARWRPLADKYDAAELLDAAERLIEDGKVTDLARFDFLIKAAEDKIKTEKNEQELIPLARKGIVVGKPGGHAMKIKAEESQKKALNEVLKHGRIEENLFKIRLGDWQNSCSIANENVHPSAPTIKKYKDFIEKELTKQNGKNISLQPYK